MLIASFPMSAWSHQGTCTIVGILVDSHIFYPLPQFSDIVGNAMPVSHILGAGGVS